MSVILNAIGGIITVRALRQARQLLQDVTPLNQNCGGLCGAVCCQSDESGENGMLLYPFEERFYQKPIPGFAFHLVKDDSLYKGGYRLVCEGSCPREHRPLACRLFPLRIRIDAVQDEARARAELDPRAYAVCPLADRGGLNGMSEAFRTAVENAGGIMLRNTFLLEALYREQTLIDEMRRL